MSFSDEIMGLFGEDLNTGFRACFFENAAYIEGVKSIKSYSREKMEITLKRGEVILKGENLTVKKYCMGDLAVCGKITSLERKGG